MSEISMDAMLAEVVKNFDGLNLKKFDNGTVGYTDDTFTVLHFTSANAKLRLLIYNGGGLSFLAVVDLSFQPTTSSERRLELRLQESELEQMFASSPVKVVSSVERKGFTHAYARLTCDIFTL